MILSLLLSLVLSVAHAQSQFSDLPYIGYFRNPYYESEGFRLGFVVDFHREGVVFRSYEGELMEGYGSDRADIVDSSCLETQMKWIKSVQDQQNRENLSDRAKKSCYMFTNPWLFSTLHSSVYEEYEKIDNTRLTPVLIYYVRPVVAASHLITMTKNFVEGIYPVNPKLEIDQFYAVPELEMPVGLTVNSARGFVDGRIVRASLDHGIRKSFEVTIQEGAYGNNFRQMSIANQDIFDRVVKAMLSGKLLRIGYVELLGIENDVVRLAKGYDTPYRVISLEVRKESSSTGLPAETK